MNTNFKFAEQQVNKGAKIISLYQEGVVDAESLRSHIRSHIDDFVAWRQVNERTSKEYKYLLDKFLRECSKPLDHVSVQEYLNKMHMLLSPHTATYQSNIIKKFLTYLDTNTQHENKVYNKIHIKRVKYEGGNKELIPDSIFKIVFNLFDLNKPDDIRDYTILKLLQSTGMRIHEPFLIKVKDIKSIYDKSGNKYYIIDSTQKGGHRLVCRLHSGTYDSIQKYLALRGKHSPEEYLFVSHRYTNSRGKSPLDKSNFYKRIKELFTAAGMPDFSSHCIRYTAAYKTIMLTEDEMKASAKLGHISPKTIQYYTANYRLELNAINDINIEL